MQTKIASYNKTAETKKNKNKKIKQHRQWKPVKICPTFCGNPNHSSPIHNRFEKLF